MLLLIIEAIFSIVFDHRKSGIRPSYIQGSTKPGFAINPATHINAFECLIELRKYLHCSLFFGKK